MRGSDSPDSSALIRLAGHRGTNDQVAGPTATSADEGSADVSSADLDYPPESLLAASTFIETIEQRQGLKISCLEEIAYRMKFIDRTQLASLAAGYNNSDYGRYLTRLLDESLLP